MRRLWLCVPPTMFALGDYLMTMWGQPPSYWTGDYFAAFEENPLVRWFMIQHPLAFHALTVVWLAVFCTAIVKLPRVPARMVSLAITFSHAFCAGTWLYVAPHGFYSGLAICIGSAVVFVIALELSEAKSAGVPLPTVGKSSNSATEPKAIS